METYRPFTRAEQRELKRGIRQAVGACNRIRMKGGTVRSETVWGCNANYLLGVLRQLEAQFNADEERGTE